MPKFTQVIRLALAEDQSIFRNGVIASLKPYPHIEVVCAAENGKSLLSQLGTIQPDIVLLDMKMPDMDGVEVCKAIKSFNPTIHVIGLSVYDHHYYISSLFEAGGSGYLLKDVDASEIVHAIEVTYKDGAYFSDSLSLPLVQKLMDINHPSVYFSETEASPLKPYEIELLKLIAKECTATEIADQMALSKRTVENYKALLMTKVGAKNTAGLVTYAIKKGIVLV